jgi:hypothetical protein
MAFTLSQPSFSALSDVQDGDQRALAVIRRVTADDDAAFRQCGFAEGEWLGAFSGGDGFGGVFHHASSSPAITFMLLMVRIASLNMLPLIISG